MKIALPKNRERQRVSKNVTNESFKMMLHTEKRIEWRRQHGTDCSLQEQHRRVRNGEGLCKGVECAAPRDLPWRNVGHDKLKLKKSMVNQWVVMKNSTARQHTFSNKSAILR
jgi:hypothetical protein